MFKLMASAKINLSLEVLGKRPDGYHNIKSVVQSICLADELEFSPANGLEFTADMPGWDGAKSLISRAAGLLQSRYDVAAGARIRVIKRIPLTSGLGGDSSCAAAALKGLNRLWRLGIGKGQLMEIGAELGSDVPFFFFGGTALIEGRGELVTPLGPYPPGWAVIMLPKVDTEGDKTGRLYGNLNAKDFSDGSRTEELVEALVKNRPIKTEMLGNAFDRVTTLVWPEIEECRWRMLRAGATRVHLSGAGPALFSLHKEKADADKVWRELKREGKDLYLVEI
ncbi:MAG: 4-(cytidine 5'-diphospho)-2-C-methyl-D-erythritol kinase [Dehalogenimonas sp.]